jgi:hypothetical protein
VNGLRVGLSSTPLPALILGLAGLLPFIGISAVLLATTSSLYAWWLETLAQYASVILAFVGALHWGFAMRCNPNGMQAWIRYAWGVLPSLLGWLALQFPVWIALRFEAGALILCYVVDRCFAKGFGAPSWFLPLRLLLTTVSSASLVAASYA